MGKLNNLELKVVRFGSEDVIATSGFIISTSDFEAAFGSGYTNAWATGDTGYYLLTTNGMTNYNDEAKGWYVPFYPDTSSVPGNYVDINPSEIADQAQGYSGYALTGHIYDAYIYNSGIYTKGASYYELYNNQ